jgi:outer membrane protein assembly factor BamB
MLSQADNMLAIATNNNKLYLYNTADTTKEPVQILLESSVSSLQSVTFQGKKSFLVGLADQSLLFYSANGAPLWKYQGKSTIFNTPYVHNDLAWVDQGNEVIALSLKDGKVMQRFSTPGGAGTPFVMNRTLYSASSKRLLYGFSL